MLVEKNDLLKEHVYGIKGEGKTVFGEVSENVGLSENAGLSCLFGIVCGMDGKDSGPMHTRSFYNFAMEKDFSGICSFDIIRSAFESDSLEILWESSGIGLELESKWAFCGKTGIWSRKDYIKNTGEQEILISRCLARFAFAPGHYEIFSQGSRWCSENEGSWQELRHGSLALSCENGRTTQGGTPFLCIRNRDNGSGVVFHIIPKGNWVIKVHARTAPGDSLPFAVLELGLSDENLHMGIKPGQSIELPEILIQELFNRTPHLSAPRLHRYLLGRLPVNPDQPVPVVYNTWFDAFDRLDTDRLHKQLEAAKNIGCEVFVVDAGWYGAQVGDWFVQAGDWREKLDGAFHGHMRGYADEVRSAGLGFGLWMEPERIGPQTPVVKQHPGWFLPGGNGYFYPDLLKEEAYSFIKSEISRLIEAYGLVWMKLDFNFDLGIDPYGSEFLFYYDAWYRLLDEVRQKYSGVFIESCASGGMRLDTNSQSHCDAHFISDNVNPTKVLNIYQGALLRLLPGRLSKWAVLRYLGNNLPKYGVLLVESPVTLITPVGATWDKSETTNISFAVMAAIPGVLGFSGNIAGLPKNVQNNLQKHMGFYKEYRKLIYNSIGYILTPISEKDDSKHWISIQLQAYDSSESILFVYRLDDENKIDIIRPFALDETMLYRVEYWNGREDIQYIHGEKLKEEGIAVEIQGKYDAVAILVSPVKEKGS